MSNPGDRSALGLEAASDLSNQQCYRRGERDALDDVDAVSTGHRWADES